MSINHNKLENCPVQEVYKAIHAKENVPFGPKSYITPKTYLNNLAIFKPIDKTNPKLKIDEPIHKQIHRSKTTKRLSQPQKKKPKPIPASQGVLHSQFGIVAKFVMTTPPLVIDRSKKQCSYLRKSDLQNKAGPQSYNVEKSFKAINQRTSFRQLPEIRKFQQRRRFYSEQIQARSVQVPGIGSYIVDSPVLRVNCKNTKLGPHLLSQREKSLEKQRQSLKNNKLSIPSPLSYNPQPRSFSLFSTLKLKQKDVLRFQEYNKNLPQKTENQMKLKQNRNPSKIGPGKYLKLTDWNQKVKDNKGENFISKGQTQSVYR